jgi:hypothetical protein
LLSLVCCTNPCPAECGIVFIKTHFLVSYLIYGRIGEANLAKAKTSLDRAAKFHDALKGMLSELSG